MSKRGFLTAAVLAGALLAAGCNAQMFNQINSTFKQVKTVSTVGATATLPAAAYATSLSVVQVMNAFNSHANGVNTSAGVIAAGGGNFATGQTGANIVAAGGGNPTFSVLDDAMHAPVFDLSDPSHSTLTVTQADGSPEMDATFAYSQSGTGNSVTYTLNSFDAHVSGFHIVCSGSFTYTAGTNRTGHMSAQLDGSSWEWLKDKSGQLANTGDQMKMSLQFNCPVPLEGSVDNIGSVTMSDDGAGMSMSATANMVNSQLLAHGTVKTPSGTSSVSVSSSGVQTSSDASASAAASASGTAQ